MPTSVNRLVIALAQIPAIVGDIAGNRDRLRKVRKEAAAFGADIVMAPELYLSGYSPEDLALKPAFQEACRAACDELARDTSLPVASSSRTSSRRESYDDLIVLTFRVHSYEKKSV